MELMLLIGSSWMIQMVEDLQVEPVEREEWVKLASRFLDHNYQQTWDYGIALAKRREAKSEHVVVRRGSEVIGIADVRNKSLPLIKGGIAYIASGPLTRQGKPEDLDKLSLALEALKEEYVKQRGFILRILGPIGHPDWMDAACQRFETAGFSPTTRSRSYRTLVVDLDRPLEDIRKGFAQKWRNCLNKAERHQLSVKSSCDIETFRAFSLFYQDFKSRKNFDADLDSHFYLSVQESLNQSERLMVSTVEIEGKIVAANVSSFLGDTCVYLLGATNEAGLKSNASYLLQWHVLTYAKELGLHWYDLGGIDPEANPGVYHFKNGLGGRDCTSPGPYQRIPSGLQGRVTQLMELAYRNFHNRLRIL